MSSTINYLHIIVTSRRGGYKAILFSVLNAFSKSPTQTSCIFANTQLTRYEIQDKYAKVTNKSMKLFGYLKYICPSGASLVCVLHSKDHNASRQCPNSKVTYCTKHSQFIFLHTGLHQHTYLQS